MEPLLRAHLLLLCAAFAAARGVQPTTVGKLSMGDSRFFGRLDAGDATFTARTYDRLVEWFSNNWPDGAAWPEGVPRLAVERAVAGPIPADPVALSSEAAA